MRIIFSRPTTAAQHTNTYFPSNGIPTSSSIIIENRESRMKIAHHFISCLSSVNSLSTFLLQHDCALVYRLCHQTIPTPRQFAVSPVHMTAPVVMMRSGQFDRISELGFIFPFLHILKLVGLLKQIRRENRPVPP